MHHHTILKSNVHPKEWKIKIQRDQKQENGNVGSASGSTKIRKWGEQHSGKTSKRELAKYLHASLSSPTTESLLKEIKQGFLKTWPGLT